ncbi:MAG TPA: hypothetical protein VFD81_12570 [Methylomirabilota bacterium]|jgi:hypothetical protein|nr:hypothetical protein [Methylomirabilota bacterium]
MGVIVALVLAMVIVGAPLGAEATGLKAKVTAPGSQRPPSHINWEPNAVHRHDGFQRFPVVVVPQPVVVVSPRRCLEPGYWAYNWVPQAYVSSGWVPGYYDSNALWVEAHYESRTYTGGYYQPYWVPERWASC